MKVHSLSSLMLVVILLALSPALGIHSQLSNVHQITLYDNFLQNDVLAPREVYGNMDQRPPQAAQTPMSSVPQRPGNETAGTQEVRTQRRQKPLRTSSTSYYPVANLELVVSIVHQHWSKCPCETYRYRDQK